MKIDPKAIKDSLRVLLAKLHKYSVVLFLVFLVGIYGFLVWQIMSLDKAEPDQSAVSAKLKTAGVPRIDPDVLNKIQQLQDNSVEVQTLFDQARSNPFQE